MTTSESDRERRTADVLKILTDSITATVPFLDRIARCEHLPAWPTAPSTPGHAVAALRQVESIRDLIGQCACHHGMPEHLYAATVRTWLNVARAAILYAQFRADRDTAIGAHHGHLHFWSTPRTVFGIALDFSAPSAPSAPQR